MQPQARSRSRWWGHQLSGIFLATATVCAVSIAIAVTSLGIGFAPVLTNSMSPALETGSVAITRQKPTSKIAVGDAIVLPLPDSDGQRYLHRVVEVRRMGSRTEISTKGDNNSRVDPWILEVTSSSAPVTVGSIPYLGWTANVLRGPILRLAFAGLIFALVIVGMVRARRQLSSHHDDAVVPSGV